jgi:hypothetical protein
MSYDPSHRKPPRQERWPQATPPSGWPSYRDDDTYRDGEHADSRYAADRQDAYPASAGYPRQAGYQSASGGPGDRGYRSAVATDTFPPVRNGYGASPGYGQADGSGDARDGYDSTADGYGGNSYGGAGNGNGNSNGYGGAGNGSGYGTGGYPGGGYPGGGYAGGINGYAGTADDFAEAANGYGGTRSGYAGTVGGYPSAADGYADAGDSFAGTADRYSRTENGYGQASHEYVGDASGYDWNENGYAGTPDGYGTAVDGYAGAADGYAGAEGGYGTAMDTFAGAPDGYGGARDDFAGSAAYLGPGSYTEPGLADPRLADPRLADPRLMAPDAGVDPDRWQADQDLRRETGRRGLSVGAVTGFLAAAVAIGVSTLAAGFVRPQASPMAALGSVFIDRTPAVLKNAAMHHFGTNGRTLLLLGMYAAIAVLAVGIGLLARRAAAPGVASLAAFSLLAAFVTITRPGGRVSDVAPAIIGGIAGVAALLWLMQASAPVVPLRHARGSARRRAR